MYFSSDFDRNYVKLCKKGLKDIDDEVLLEL